ncbi:hypothetical protein M231_02069 [Tremella mesenterica]|uniref:Uncharacterized protein n=1 Tax=Tremella mesenterica TaxID=5217 RepID=A0A4Q1BRL2_TREME|nr:hypothetical protein M231_02069 [Tremella mesenterica]
MLVADEREIRTNELQEDGIAPFPARMALFTSFTLLSLLSIILAVTRSTQSPFPPSQHSDHDTRDWVGEYGEDVACSSLIKWAETIRNYLIFPSSSSPPSPAFLDRLPERTSTSHTDTNSSDQTNILVDAENGIMLPPEVNTYPTKRNIISPFNLLVLPLEIIHVLLNITRLNRVAEHVGRARWSISIIIMGLPCALLEMIEKIPGLKGLDP